MNSLITPTSFAIQQVLRGRRDGSRRREVCPILQVWLQATLKSDMRVATIFFMSCRSIQHHCQWYFAKFLVCETLNFLLLFLNFWATDQGISPSGLPCYRAFQFFQWTCIWICGQPGCDTSTMCSSWTGSSSGTAWTSCNTTKCLCRRGNTKWVFCVMLILFLGFFGSVQLIK